MFCYTSKLKKKTKQKKNWEELICLMPAGTTNLPSFNIYKVLDLITCEWKAQVLPKGISKLWPTTRDTFSYIR